MNNREKLLGILVLAILVGLGARSVHSRLGDAYSFYSTQETAKQNALHEAELKNRAGMEAMKRLDDWRERSLPSDPSFAKSKYYNWLRDELAAAGANASVAEKSKPTPATDGSKLLAFTVKGDFSIESLTDFLYAFYTAKHFHKISNFQLTPEDATGGTLNITMEVEAYLLPDADREDDLAKGSLERLALDSLDDYHDSIVDRNIFAVYTPPKEGVEESDIVEIDTPPPFEHVKFAKATGIVEWNGRPQVWINVQTTGKMEKLYPGESFKIDDLTVKIIDVGTRTVVFEADGERYTVKLGNSLRDGTPIDPENAT